MNLAGETSHFFAELADDESMDVFIVGATEISGRERFLAMASKAATIWSHPPEVKMPARSSARAKACEPCTSAKISLLSKSAILKIVRRPPKVRFQSVHPRVS